MDIYYWVVVAFFLISLGITIYEDNKRGVLKFDSMDKAGFLIVLTGIMLWPIVLLISLFMFFNRDSRIPELIYNFYSTAFEATVALLDWIEERGKFYYSIVREKFQNFIDSRK